MKRAYLELKKLTKSFGKGQDMVVAVDAIDLDVQEGELVTLLGPSGCGKTTTLRMIAGFHTPTSGDVLIDGVASTRSCRQAADGDGLRTTLFLI